MLCLEIYKYIDAAKGQPFFYVVGDKEYREVLNELQENGLDMVRISAFCYKDDKFPDIDEVVDSFRTLDVDCKSNKIEIGRAHV